MRLLLDTHALLWWWEGSALLSRAALKAIHEPEAEIFVSAASAWEAATKFRFGKLVLKIPVAAFEAQLRSDGFIPLPITMEHAVQAGSYPQAHRDPFDRLLIAQAEIEGMALVTNDRALSDFPGRRLW